jgi:hypothetical protein
VSFAGSVPRCQERIRGHLNFIASEAENDEAKTRALFTRDVNSTLTVLGLALNGSCLPVCLFTFRAASHPLVAIPVTLTPSQHPSTYPERKLERVHIRPSTQLLCLTLPKIIRAPPQRVLQLASPSRRGCKHSSQQQISTPDSMPKLKYGQSTLSGLIESDSEDAQFVDAMPTPDSAAENRPPGKKARGRPKVAPAKVTKAKAPARRTSGRLTAKMKEPPTAISKSKRPALADKTNQQYASETEEVEDFDPNEDVDMGGEDLEDSIVAMKEAKPKATKNKAATAAKGKAARETSRTHNIIGVETPEVSKSDSRMTKKRGPSKKALPADPSTEKVVMETQVPAMDIDADVDEDEIVEKPISKTAHNTSRARSNSRHRQPSIQRRRAGSASDTERNDPALRRKLGEVTKKYENLHLKYQDLREIGLKEAERNFERLKKQSEEKTKSMSCPDVSWNRADSPSF